MSTKLDVPRGFVLYYPEVEDERLSKSSDSSPSKSVVDSCGVIQKKSSLNNRDSGLPLTKPTGQPSRCPEDETDRITPVKISVVVFPEHQR
jgi:hypothetical protein